MTAYQKTSRRPSIGQTYSVYWRALRAIPALRKYESNNTISEKSAERLMLAVTEVNGCALCSYAHTKIALEAGLDEKEISHMLAGMNEDVPAEDRAAVLFAQHYAETKGRPSQLALQKIDQIYGPGKTDAILCAIQVIMLGNTFGIPFGALASRIKHKENHNGPQTSILYEIGMLLAAIIFLPFAALTALAASLLHLPRTALEKRTAH